MNEQTRRGCWPIALIALIAILAAPVSARPLSLLPADAVVIDDAQIADVSKRSQTQVESMLSAVSAGRADEALGLLRSIDSVLAFELTAASVIARLQAADDTESARSVLLGLAETPVRVFMRHEETAADWFVPVFSIGQRARSALRLLDQRREIDEWKHQLTVDPMVAMQALSQAVEQVDYAAAAIAGLPPQQGLVLSQRLRENGSVQTPSAVARELALKAADLHWFEQVAQNGTAPDLLTLIARSDTLKRDQAASWLLGMSARGDVGSAALIALSEHAHTGSAALERLVDTLDDQGLGPSAAAALARRPQADRMAVLADLSRRGDLTPRALGRVALALRLEGSKASTALLGELSLRDELPSAVREELLR